MDAASAEAQRCDRYDMALLAFSAGDKPRRVRDIASGLRNRVNRVTALASFLFSQRVIGFKVGDAPEFEAASAPLFTERLNDAGSYLEFGSGGSTVLAAQIGKPLVVVESDPIFLAAVQRKLREAGVTNGAVQTLLHADIGLTEAWGTPVFRANGSERAAQWRRYAEAPWETLAKLPGPHLVLVDGRFRVACALSAVKFLRDRAGEILIDDYLDRPHYRVVERYLRLERMAGRMALMRLRGDIDFDALDRDIEAHYADWR